MALSTADYAEMIRRWDYIQRIARSEMIQAERHDDKYEISLSVLDSLEYNIEQLRRLRER